ncbi:MAG: hypothetical protein HY748_13660 [Elusimicrobia bacterium]|nr:hypothetical protein [Elusimicrobiota bacterium]
MDQIDTEQALDYEYFSDLQAFSIPMEWDLAWQSPGGSTMSYRGNGASLDCCSLLWSQELKSRWRLAETMNFTFRLNQAEDKERRRFHYQVGFEKRLPRGFSVSLFGEPAYDKEDSDIGLGAGWKPSEGIEVSLRLIVADFPLNRKAGGPQRYSRQPITQELRADAAVGAGRLRLHLELDHPTRREVWADARSYSYRKTTARTEYLWPVRHLTAKLSYGFEYHHEGDYYSPDPASKSVDYRRMTQTVLAAALADLGADDSLEAGHSLILRHARNDHPHDPGAGIMYRRWEAQPFARWRHRASRLVATELAAFLSLGEYRKRHPAHLIPSVFDPLIQAKLGAGLDLTFGPKGRLGFYGAFDLDDMASHPWDGGGIRAMFVF